MKDLRLTMLYQLLRMRLLLYARLMMLTSIPTPFRFCLRRYSL